MKFPHCKICSYFEKNSFFFLFRSIVGPEHSDADIGMPSYHETNKIEKMLKNKIKSKVKEYQECETRDYVPEAAEAIMNILRGLHTNQKWDYLTSPNKRECLGRELCLRALKSHKNDASLTSVQTIGYMLESFALLYHEIDDHSISFSEFIEVMTEKGGPQTIEDCFSLFENCGEDEVYQTYKM